MRRNYVLTEFSASDYVISRECGGDLKNNCLVRNWSELTQHFTDCVRIEHDIFFSNETADFFCIQNRCYWQMFAFKIFVYDRLICLRPFRVSYDLNPRKRSFYYSYTLVFYIILVCVFKFWWVIDCNWKSYSQNFKCLLCWGVARNANSLFFVCGIATVFLSRCLSKTTSCFLRHIYLYGLHTLFFSPSLLNSSSIDATHNSTKMIAFSGSHNFRNKCLSLQKN